LETEYFSEKDENPLVGDNFYRLKMTLLDGSDIFTDEQLVHFEATNTFTAFPNPAAEVTYLDLKALAGHAADIHFVSSFGKVLKTVHFNELPNDPISLDLSDLANGLWILRIESDGWRSDSVKLMINHLD
jgi:hypothetical protein